MKSPVETMSIDTFVPMLRSLSKIFDKAAQHAKAKSIDGAVLANARLAPDMFPLARQVQIACDMAKNGIARLMGKEPPKFEDNEQTLDQLKARIERTIEYLDKADRSALQGAEDREITIPFPDGRVLEMKGLQLLRDWTLPHFYFHVVTAYDILRHNGVDIGKLDYLSHVGGAIRERGELRKAG
ncbi:MAG: DUF1993 domain-containing protein [Hyphomicrobiales bacterium]|nr:DUF1993 domain-containing protein [Hyphomicrobiales bacterium]